MKTVEERFAKGMEKGREMLGDRWDLVVRALEETNPDLARYTVEWAYGEVFHRPGLEPKTRELIAVASLTTLRLGPQLKTHIHAAMNYGATEAELMEVVIQLALYHGFPTAVFGAQAIREVASRRGESTGGADEDDS